MKMVTTMTSDIHQSFKCQIGILSRPDGSVALSQGDTIMLAAVYGPHESKLQNLQIDKAFVESHYRPKCGIPGVKERLLESVIRNTCETAITTSSYPRATISVIVQEIQDCGELIGCAMNAACLALIDAGIDMNFLVAAVTCVTDSEGNLIIEPDTIASEKAIATGTFVFESTENKILTVHTKGTFTADQYKEACLKCKTVSEKIFGFYKTIFLKNKNT